MNAAKYLLLIAATSLTFAQNHWSAEQIDDAFSLVREDSQSAVALVQSWGADPYDFGLDLLAQGRGYQALTWFDRLAQVNDANPGLYLVGMAWSYRALGMQEVAQEMVFDLINDENPLVQARSTYLLGLLYLDQGDRTATQSYLNLSQEHYASLGRQGGVDLAQRVLDSLFVNGKAAGSGPGSPGLPPRNDGDA